MANEFVVKNGLIVKTGTITIGDIATTGYAFPTTTGTTGQVLKVDANGDLEFGASGAGVAGGSNTEIQFNNSGSLAGDPDFTWITGTNTLQVNGAIDIDNILIDGNTIASTNTNGDIILDPNGTGQVAVPSGYAVISNNSLVTKSYVDGQGFLKNVVEDTTPQLGGDLDMNGFKITTLSNADVLIVPNGTGVISVLGTTNYEANVTDDDDIPNKKYVDDQIALNIGSGVFSGALVTRTTAQSIPNATVTTISWDGIGYDISGSGNWYNISNPTRLTVPTGVSRVKISAAVEIQASTNHHQMVITKNGTPVWIGSAGNQDFTSTSGALAIILSATSPVVDVIAGDYFEVTVYHTGGAPQNIQPTTSWFSAQAITTTIGGGGTGTVTSVNTGAGLSGGPITTTGTINLDFTLPTVTPASGDLVIIQDASDSNNRKTVDLGSILTPPGGSNTQIQYNNGGVFAGDTGFTTDGAGNVNIIGSLDVDDININGNTISSTGVPANVDLNLSPKGTGVVNVNNSYITNLLDPVNPQDAATKAYVDATASGLDPKESVRVATTANVNLGVGGLLTIDGVTLVSGDRVLVKNQTDPKENGIYIANSGAWTRSDDMNGTPTSEISGGNYTFVEAGVTYAGTGWVVVWDGEVVLGTDPIIWTQFSESTSISAGAGLSGTTTLDVNVTGTNTFINGSDQVSVGHATVSQVGKFLAGAAALTDATWEYVTQLKDSAGDIAVNITGAATSTLDITTNATDVILATTGTNIDLVLNPSGTGLVVAPSGYNMSSGPASAFATKDYVDSQGFLKNIVEDTTPQLGGNLDMNGNNIVTTSNANINLIPDGTGVVSIDGIEYTKRLTGVINNNQTSALAIITYNAANYEAAFIEYVIRRSTDGSRTGTLHVINDNTNVAVSDTGAEIGDIGVTFTAAISGGNVEIRYTSTNTGNAGTIAYTIRRWNA